jgi:hypothetical protein
MKDETKLDDFSRVAEDKTWPPRKYVINPKWIEAGEKSICKIGISKEDLVGVHVGPPPINYAI